MRRDLRNSTIVVSLFCLVVTPALAGPFNFDDETNQGWSWAGFFDDDGLVPITDAPEPIPGGFRDVPAGWADGYDFPDATVADLLDEKGSIYLGFWQWSIPESPSGADFVHWDLNSPDLSADPYWQTVSKFTYDVLGRAYTTNPYYVQTVLHVQKPDLSEAYFTDGLFHHVPYEGDPDNRTWKTYEVDVESMGIPGGSTILDVNLRFFCEAGDDLNGLTHVDNVTAGIASSGTDRVWGGLQTGHPSADGFAFANPANWYGYVVPGPGDRPVFEPVPAVTPYTVVPTGTTNRQLVVNAPAHLNLSGGIYRIDAASPRTAVTVGETGHFGELRLQHGTFESRFGSSVIGNGFGRLLLGGDATWNANKIIVGNAGQGILEVYGLIEADRIVIANSESAVGHAVVDGGIVNVTGPLEVGVRANGTLTIGYNVDGGAVTSVNGYIGRRTDSVGKIGVHRGSSWNNSGSIYVGGGESGAGGTGELYVTSEAQVSAAGDVTVWPTGMVELNQGTLAADNLILDGGRLTGQGNIRVDGAFINRGQVEPGSSPGTLVIDGSYEQNSSGSLQIDIAGTILGDEYDSLEVLGSASLQGALTVQLVAPPSFLPTAGDTFDILTATGGISGEFAQLLLPTLSGSLFWNVNYDNPTAVTLEVLGMFADFDEDGDVDGDDFLCWQTGFGIATGAAKMDGDFDEDGDVDGDDFLGWQSEFGSGSGSASAAVPEPASIALLFMFAVVGMFSRVVRTAYYRARHVRSYTVES